MAGLRGYGGGNVGNSGFVLDVEMFGPAGYNTLLVPLLLLLLFECGWCGTSPGAQLGVT